jgi:hypothetical protein
MAKDHSQQPDTLSGSGNGHGARDTLAETASAAAGSMQSAATDQIEQQKRAASESIQAFAQAVRRASDELKDQDQTAAAQLIQQAAGGLESLSETLSNRSFGDMVEMARDFGRRNPMALAGGAALLGLALGRVARTATGGNGSHETYGSSEQPTRSNIGSMSGSSAAGEFPASRASTTRRHFAVHIHVAAAVHVDVSLDGSIEVSVDAQGDYSAKARQPVWRQDFRRFQ